MTFTLVLTVVHPKIPDPIEHVDMICAASKSALLKTLELNNKQLCDLRSFNRTYWVDEHGGTNTLELREEALT